MSSRKHFQVVVPLGDESCFAGNERGIKGRATTPCSLGSIVIDSRSAQSLEMSRKSQSGVSHVARRLRYVSPMLFRGASPRGIGRDACFRIWRLDKQLELQVPISTHQGRSLPSISSASDWCHIVATSECPISGVFLVPRAVRVRPERQ